MRLSQLLTSLPPGLARPLSPGHADPDVLDIAYDSRQVAPGSLFVAWRGEKTDGHRFIADAVQAGAVAVMGADPAALVDAAAPTLLTEHARRAMALMADALYGHPSRQLRVTAVTGTNGKTTTVHLVERIWSAMGEKTGRIGTLGARLGDVQEEAPHTTPEGPDVFCTLARMRDAGAKRVAMEVSSHALEQERVAGLYCPVTVFTNLSQDHLDYHRDMESYYAAKERLFTDYEPRNGWAVLNVDDEAGRRLADATPRRVLTYGMSPQADLQASRVEPTSAGLRLSLAWKGASRDVSLRLPGLFNAANAMAALGAVLADGGDFERSVSALEDVSGAPGRFESVDVGQGFAVLVDYAHTPDALDNVLRAAREITPSGRVIVVFGCGGDRDRTKRPLMGRIAAELADLAFVTSDNPRTEDPAAIIREIVAGMGGATNYSVNPDRRTSIHAAIEEARAGDTLVIAGKGHEDYQIVGAVKHHFDDCEVAREALHAKGGAA